VNNKGEPTSHIKGVWNRTINMIEMGMRPVWVFDGWPPKMKLKTMWQRNQRKDTEKDRMREAETDQSKGYAQIREMEAKKLELTERKASLSKNMNKPSQGDNMDTMMEEWAQINKEIKQLDTELHNSKDELEKSKTKVTKLHQRPDQGGEPQKEQVVKLLKLMGMPIVQSPSEAEAQCAELSKEDKIWGVATEDMDTLCPAQED